MTDKLNEKISQLVDDELTTDEALHLLKKLQQQPEYLDTLNRYQTISHALKTEVFLPIASDFAARVHTEIQPLPTYLLPARKPKALQIKRQLFAAAASVALLAVIIGSRLEEPLKSGKPVYSVQTTSPAITPVQIATQAAVPMQPSIQTVVPIQITPQTANIMQTATQAAIPMQLATRAATTSRTSKPSANIAQIDQRPLHTRINDYLQAHSRSGYSNGEAFTSLVSFDKE